jgi:hypothetical protein
MTASWLRTSAKSRAGSAPIDLSSRLPLLPPRIASDRIAEAKDMLYDGDYCIIEKIAGIGHSLERCAGELLGHYPLQG